MKKLSACRGWFVGVVVLALGTANCGSSDAGGGAPGAGAEVTSFSPPPRKGGEQWTTRITTSNPAVPPDEGTYYVDVGGGEGAGFVARYVPSDGRQPVQLTYNNAGQLVQVATCSFTPALNTFTYPMAIGSKWTVDYKSCGSSRITGTGEVVGREKIATPLGELDTLKVVITTASTSIPMDDATPPVTNPAQTLTAYWSILYGLVAKSRLDVPPSGPDGHAVDVEEELRSYLPKK